MAELVVWDVVHVDTADSTNEDTWNRVHSDISEAHHQFEDYIGREGRAVRTIPVSPIHLLILHNPFAFLFHSNFSPQPPSTNINTFLTITSFLYFFLNSVFERNQPGFWARTVLETDPEAQYRPTSEYNGFMGNVSRFLSQDGKVQLMTVYTR